MNIETQYSVGDVVFRPFASTRQTEVKCPDCLGSRTWEAHLPNGEIILIECPCCKFGFESRGTISNWDPSGEIQTLTIGSVQVDTHRNEIRYMCEETGVGSGGIYSEDQFFPTEEEAATALPEMIRKCGIEFAEQRATSRKRKIKDGPGSMAAYYRAQIRDAKRDIERAERGLEREKGTQRDA